MLKGIEERLGLPPLAEGVGILAGPTGKRLVTLLSSLEALSKDKESLKNVAALLELIERLDRAGTIARLNELLRELKPLTKGKIAQLLLEKLDKIEELARALMKED